MRNMLHRGYFTIVQLSTVWGQDANIYIEKIDQFGKFYGYKLSSYRIHLPIATELDFINDNLKNCDSMTTRCRECINTPFGQSGRSLSDFELEYEVKLIEKWRNYLLNSHKRVSEAFDPVKFINQVRTGQAMLTLTDYNNISVNIQRCISDSFKYFQNKYDATWHKTLHFVFTTIAQRYYFISTSEIRPDIVTELKMDLDIHVGRVNEKLDEFERFFQHILEKNSTDDCVRLLVLLKGIILDFKVILRGHGYYFEKSYFYNVINDFYKRMESEYNADKLRLLTFKETSIKSESKQISKRDSNPKSYSHRQIAIAHFVMGIIITTDNALDILTKYSKHTSTAKLIQNRIAKKTELTNISKSKSANTYHLKDLLAVKRLISGTQDENSLKSINLIITEFQAKLQE